MPLPNAGMPASNERAAMSLATIRLDAEVSRAIGCGIASAAEMGSTSNAGPAGAGPLPEPFANGGGFVDPLVGAIAGMPSQLFAAFATSDDRSGPGAVPLSVSVGDGALSNVGAAAADAAIA